MEYGTHCNFADCNALDFLPIKCDACSNLYCENHMQYERHRCEGAHRKNVQVPVCPLCNVPVPVAPGESPDVRVGRHIDNDCRSDPALAKRSRVNRCVARNCKKRDLTSIKCPDCQLTVCIKHRLPEDHDCVRLRREVRIPEKFRQQQTGNNWWSSATSGWGALAGQSSTTVGGNQNRSHQQPHSLQSPSPRPPTRQSAAASSRLNDSRDVSMGNAGMSESEALQAALRLSESTANTPREQSSQNNPQPNSEQEQLDYQLALMMQQEQFSGDSSNSSANSRRRITANSPAAGSTNNCSVQ